MDILRRRRLLADGYSPAELRRDVRTGALVALRRGAYVDPATMPHPPEVRHALAVRAAWPALVSGAVIGHASAAETLDTYSHLWPDSDDRTRAAIDAVLGQSPGDRVTKLLGD